MINNITEQFSQWIPVAWLAIAAPVLGFAFKAYYVSADNKTKLTQMETRTYDKITVIKEDLSKIKQDLAKANAYLEIISKKQR